MQDLVYNYYLQIKPDHIAVLYTWLYLSELLNQKSLSFDFKYFK
jgi:DUF971 family protein